MGIAFGIFLYFFFVFCFNCCNTAFRFSSNTGKIIDEIFSRFSFPRYIFYYDMRTTDTRVDEQWKLLYRINRAHKIMIKSVGVGEKRLRDKLCRGLRLI